MAKIQLNERRKLTFKLDEKPGDPNDLGDDRPILGEATSEHFIVTLAQAPELDTMIYWHPRSDLGAMGAPTPIK